MENCGFMSLWHWKQSFGAEAVSNFSFASSASFGACTLWQLVQPTAALACGERWKFGCVPAWHPRQRAVTCFSVAVLKLKIFDTSPPPSTCSRPGPWQLSQLAPLLPCCNASLVCGLSAKFFTASVWQPAQVSEPTKSPVGCVCADCALIVLVPVAGFASCAALHATLDATANPSKQAPSKRNPRPAPSGILKRFAPGLFCITGFISFICFFPFPCNPR